MKPAAVGIAMSLGLMAAGSAGAATVAGRPFSWGVDRWGTLGDPALLDDMLDARPVDLDGIPELTALDAGHDGDIYGVGVDGDVHRWDLAGSMTTVPSPDAGAEDIAVGRGFAVMLDADGDLWRVVTSRSSAGRALRPLSLPNGVSVTDVSAEGAVTMAVGDDGALYRWASSSDTSSAQRAGGLPSGVGAAEIDMGTGASVVRTTDGRVLAWGGALATAAGRVSEPRPVSLPDGVTATSVVAGHRFVLVLGSNGRVYSLGSDAHGQRGDGPGLPAPDLVSEVALPTGATAIRVLASGDAAMAVAADGTTYRWGLIAEANGERTHSLVALGPVVLEGNGGGPIVDMVMSGATTVMTDGQGTVSVTGPLGGPTRRIEPAEILIPGEATVRQVSIASHTLAIGASGELSVWGSNRSGQLGIGVDPPATAQPRRITLPNSDRAASVAAGQRFSVVASVDGSLYTWGDNRQGQLGSGQAGDEQWNPVAVELATGVGAVQVAAGRVHSAAIGSDGKVYVWGCCGPVLGRGAAPNDAARPLPVALPSGAIVSEVVAGDGFTALRTTSGELFAWGLGVGAEPRRLDVPPISHLAAGGHQLVVVTVDGKVLGIGSSGFGRPSVSVGTAEELDADLTAAEIGVASVVNPAAGESLGLDADGTFGLDSSAAAVSTRLLLLPAGVTATQVAAGRGWAVVLGSDRHVYQWRNGAMRVVPGTADLLVVDVAAGAGVGYLMVASSGEVSEPMPWLVMAGGSGVVGLWFVLRRGRIRMA